MEIKRRIVKLKTRDKRYIKGSSYPFIPAQREQGGVFLTGQLVDPSDSSTRGFLTLAEATGESFMSDEKRKMFRYVINPNDVIALRNNDQFDLTVDEKGLPLNDRDTAIHNMLKLNTNKIAASREEYNPLNHIFWLEDVEAVAATRLNRERKEADLKYRIYRLDYTKLKDLALLLNIYDKSFKSTPDLVSEEMLTNKITDLMKVNMKAFDDIFDEKGAFSKRATKDMMIAKLVDMGLIRVNINEFLYENAYIGGTVEEVQRWMSDGRNRNAVAKLTAMLGQAAPQETVVVGEVKEELKKEDKSKGNIKK